MGYDTRTREEIYLESEDVVSLGQPDGSTEVSRYRRFIETGQITQSRDDPRWPIRHRILDRHPWMDIGSEFYTSRTSYWHNLPVVNIYDASAYGRSYNGYIWPSVHPTTNTHGDGWSLDAMMAADAVVSRNELNIAGAYAINKTIPTHPAASLSTFVGELREGLPSVVGGELLRERIGFFRSLGKEYLNVEFGWLPFLRDLQKLGEAHRKMDLILQQLERDSDRAIRRRYTFPTVDDARSVETSKKYAWPPNRWVYASIPTGGWSYTRESVASSEMWFTGRYRYHYRPSSSSLNRFHEDLLKWNKVYGLAVTPDTLWNLAPWSWLADWFGNLGTIASNASAFLQDGLLLNRGYLMCTKQLRVTHTMLGVRPYGRGPRDLVVEFNKTTKVRDKASPYGFGLKFEGFTPRQIAILTALGLAKSKPQ